MKQHIQNFPTYLQHGYTLAKDIELSWLPTYTNIVFVGMWWSAMALWVMKSLLDRAKNTVPSQVIRSYTVPSWVDKHTLVICASYSGNTEETVAAMKDALAKWATMIAITSWWELEAFARSWGHVYATMPTGIEPRAALPYSLGIQLRIMQSLWHIDDDVDALLWWFTEWCVVSNDTIDSQSKTIANKIFDRFPCVYSTSGYESLTLRTVQQLQENSRMLAHGHILPEHNHNELLWWQEGSDVVDVIWLLDPTMYERNAMRVELTKQVLDDRNIAQHTITLAGDTVLAKILTWIYQVDRLSYRTALERDVDPSGMELIEWLKGELKKR